MAFGVGFSFQASRLQFMALTNSEIALLQLKRVRKGNKGVIDTHINIGQKAYLIKL